MNITRLKRLTDSDFRALAHTELFAELVNNKYKITCNDRIELNNLLTKIEDCIPYLWYFAYETTSSPGIGYLYCTTEATDSISKMLT